MEKEDDKVGFQVKDLRVVLKDMEPMVKSADSKGRLFLIDGHNKGEPAGVIPIAGGGFFKMRYREAWGNWLLCALLSHVHNQDVTFQEDEEGDGIIVNRTTGRWFPVEHVSGMTYGKGEELPKNEERVLSAINKKIEKDKKNPGYANGKTLVVFIDGAELWFPNKVGRAIEGTHNFSNMYCIGLTSSEENPYIYSVSELHAIHSPTFLIEINKDFTGWEISQVQ